jgi:4-hydroxybenzoate polyprenyltransferase
LAAVLTVVGLASACAAGGPAIAIAAALTVLILAYDGFLKKTVAGPVAMGGCRMLNILLGASGAELFVWKSTPVAVAAAMGIYVAGITWFARQEAVRSARTQLVAASLVIHGGIALLFVLLVGSHSRGEIVGLSAAALAVVTGLIEIRLVPALRDPTPQRVQAAVKRLLLAIVLFDATMVYWATGNPTLACGTALLVVPAATLGRWIFIT